MRLAVGVLVLTYLRFTMGTIECLSDADIGRKRCSGDCTSIQECTLKCGLYFWIQYASCGEQTCHLINGSPFCSQTESDCPAPTPEPPTSDGSAITSTFTSSLSSTTTIITTTTTTTTMATTPTTNIATTGVRPSGVQQACDYTEVYTRGCTGPVLREITTGISWPRCLVSCHLHHTCICVQYKGDNSCLFYEGVE